MCRLEDYLAKPLLPNSSASTKQLETGPEEPNGPAQTRHFRRTRLCGLAGRRGRQTLPVPPNWERFTGCEPTAENFAQVPPSMAEPCRVL